MTLKPNRWKDFDLYYPPPPLSPFPQRGEEKPSSVLESLRVIVSMYNIPVSRVTFLALGASLRGSLLLACRKRHASTLPSINLLKIQLDPASPGSEEKVHRCTCTRLMHAEKLQLQVSLYFYFQRRKSNGYFKECMKQECVVNCYSTKLGISVDHPPVDIN